MSSHQYQLNILTVPWYRELSEHRYSYIQLAMWSYTVCITEDLPIQCCLGSGWLLEPFEGSETKTLVSYVVNVGHHACTGTTCMML